MLLAQLGYKMGLHPLSVHLSSLSSSSGMQDSCESLSVTQQQIVDTVHRKYSDVAESAGVSGESSVVTAEMVSAIKYSLYAKHYKSWYQSPKSDVTFSREQLIFINDNTIHLIVRNIEHIYYSRIPDLIDL